MKFNPAHCFTRTPDPAWQRQLDELAPPHPLKARLVVRWHAGRSFWDDATNLPVWQPIERWIIWEVLPTALMSPLFPAVKRMVGREADGGWPARGLHGVPGQLELDRSLCDRAQWSLFLETRQYARMAWVVQGSRGGHQRQFSEWQQLGLSRRGLPDTPPYPSQLPYADVDERVFAQLRILRDCSPAWNDISARAERAWHLLDDAEKSQALGARQALADWAEGQMYDVLDSTTRKDRAEFRDAFPHGLGRPDHLGDPDELVAAYIEGAE